MTGWFEVPGSRLRQLREAEETLLKVEAVIQEPLDERAEHGPTRHTQFARIDGFVTEWRRGRADDDEDTATREDSVPLLKRLISELDDSALVSMHARAEAYGWPLGELMDEMGRRGLSIEGED